MNGLEKEFISEMDCGNNFAYILDNDVQFLSTEYKVLHNQGEDDFIKCVKLTYNGKLQFYYLIEGYKSLESILSILDIDMFMTIVSNVFSNIMDIKENGFLSCQNIDISINRIYIDPNTYKVKLIYLPVSKHFFQDESSFESKLRTELIELLSDMPFLNTDQIKQFIMDLSNRMLTLQELYNRMKNGVLFDVEKKKNTQGNQLQIVSINMSNKVVINVTKDEFVIGKKFDEVDGVISNNKMISRIHCKIIKNDSQYYILDLHSANGTYVNCVKLEENKPCLIKNGDIIRLANMDFKVLIR